MPTLLLLDVSLSMCRRVKASGTSDPIGAKLIDLGINFIAELVESLKESVSMEYVAIGLFSDDVELVVPYTTEYEAIKSLCQNGVEVHGKSLLGPALRFANLSGLSTWGRNTFCEIIVITDGLCDEAIDFQLSETGELSDFSLPFAFPSVVKFVLLNNDESAICLPFYERICEKNYQTNSSGVTEGLHIVDVEHPDGVVSLVGELIDQDYKKFFATLTCGSLSSPVELVPSPRAVHKLVRDFEVTEGIFSGTISILGFMKPADLSHAPIVARHLVIAVSKGDHTGNGKSKTSTSAPSLCVLLHGSFKLEENVAICQIGENWYAMLYVLPEVKKTHLVLNCFTPGVDSIPWLGDLSSLKLKVFDGNQVPSCFPVMQKQRCSYFTSPQQANLSFPCWIQNFGLQADIQKVLRYVRKLPEKQLQFYQELNRLCNYALAIGFSELMEETIVALLEKEANNAHQNNPEAAKHLQHARTLLKSKRLVYGEPVKPL